MNSPVVSEIPPNLMFRYRFPCKPIGKDSQSPVELPAGNTLPDLGGLNQHQPPAFAEVRTAWSPTGLYLHLKVKGKKQSVWCRNTQLLESDGIQVWIDTRDTHNVHRATRFCHWFMLLPAGDGSDRSKPIATMLKINRAKEHSPSLNRFPVKIECSFQKTGYKLSAFLPSTSLNGWSPEEYRKIGFNFLVTDRELGQQTLGVGSGYPIAEDPSLWSTLLLEKPATKS